MTARTVRQSTLAGRVDPVFGSSSVADAFGSGDDIRAPSNTTLQQPYLLSRLGSCRTYRLGRPHALTSQHSAPQPSCMPTPNSHDEEPTPGDCCRSCQTDAFKLQSASK